MRNVLLLALVAIAAWQWLDKPTPLIEESGPLLPDAATTSSFDHPVSFKHPPIQFDIEGPAAPIRAGDYTITRRANIQLEAKVLGQRDYQRDNAAPLSPMDLALAWGPMAEDHVIEQIEVNQRRRFYYWRTDRFPIPRREIERNSANMHIVPVNQAIASQLKSIEDGDIIRLVGYLIDAERNDGWRWETSMTREDTGRGACEIILVTRLSRR